MGLPTARYLLAAALCAVWTYALWRLRDGPATAAR